MAQTDSLPLVLLAEDSEPDAQLTSVVLKRSGISHRLDIVRDGEECLSYLQSCLKEGRPLPNLVLLDLSMPKLDGRGVLRRIKDDEALRAIPVVVLSTSGAKPDVDDALALHANAYVVKPLRLKEFDAALTATAEFWLGTAE